VDELERGRIALLIHMGHKDKSLKDFIECLDVNNAQPFIEARQRLVRVVENVRELNTESRSLLELSVKWIEDSVSLIAQLLMPEASSYSPVMDKKQNKQQQEAAIIHSTVDHSA
jgi:hypothetical protein